jgi:hypothetical protein
MVWAALTIILMQGVIALVALKLVNSFGAFTRTLIRTHEENLLVHAHNDEISERNSATARQIRRVADSLHHVPTPPPSSDQERSA